MFLGLILRAFLGEPIRILEEGTHAPFLAEELLFPLMLCDLLGLSGSTLIPHTGSFSMFIYTSDSFSRHNP
jgi:hypothetical protein